MTNKSILNKMHIELFDEKDFQDAIVIFDEYRFDYVRVGNKLYFSKKEEGVHAKSLLDEEGFVFSWNF